MRSRLLTLAAALAAAAHADAQSITAAARVETPLFVGAVLSPLPNATSGVAAGTALPSGALNAVSNGGGQVLASTRFTLGQAPVSYRIEEATAAVASGFAVCGTHATRLTLTVTREYSGDVVIHWNGIEQNDGTGAMLAEVDVDADGTFEFSATDGQTVTMHVQRSWGPGAPLHIITRTYAECGGPLEPASAFKGILTVSFDPDTATVAPGDFEPFGFGCGSIFGGAPLLSGAGVEGPLVGELFTAQVSFLPPTTVGIFILLGFQETPPFHLAPIGMELCFLFLEPIYTEAIAVPPPGPPAAWNILIPNDTGAIGLQFFVQAVIVEPTIPGLGAIISNPCKGTIGGR